MPDILKEVLSELPQGVVKTANFEGANIVIYTSSKDFFLKGEQKIREVVEKIKKRIELRAAQELLLDEAKAEKLIKQLIPKEAEIQAVLFDSNRSICVIEVRKPGIAIGKSGELLEMIKQQTFWIPRVIRSPAIPSKITDAIRHVLYAKEEYRRRFLHQVGKRIYTNWSPERREEWVRVALLGGARQVGRSCLLLQTPESRVLLDCGIDIAAQNRERFPYFDAPEFDIDRIDAVIVSHAHLDHSGLLPYLYKIGYRGPCYMTLPTRDVSALLALDYIGVAYKRALSPLYKVADVEQMVKHCITLDYNEVTDITSDLRLTFYNAGHTIGSSIIHLNIGNGLHNLVYTADFKYANTNLLQRAAAKFPRLETLIIESTYGGKDNVLPQRKEAEAQLIEAINRTIKRNGKVLIPVLGVGRAQEVMLILNEAFKQGKLPSVPVYIDGLVWDVTAIHTAYPEYLAPKIKEEVFQGKNPFVSELFNRVGSPAERKEVIEGKPCIILATSGMLVGGASVEYFRELADSPRNLIAFVSYQSQTSLGRKIQEGLKEVKLPGPEQEETVQVKLEVLTVEGLTGHSDRQELLNYVNALTPTPHRIIVQHGEPSRALDLASTLYKLHRIETNVPRNLEVLRLK